MATQREYEEQDRLVKEKTAIVQPWLEKFANDYNEKHPDTIGTGFYSDVTILLGSHGNFFWDTEAGKKLRELDKMGKISRMCVKRTEAAFIIEYRFDGNRLYNYKNELIQLPHSTPTRAYFLFNEKQYPVPMHVAMAAKDLHWAQEYRGILWGLLNGMSR